MVTLKIITHEQSRAEYFKKQREKAQRSLEWAIKHSKDEYVIEEKAEILNFYEWAEKMAGIAAEQKTNIGEIVKCKRCWHLTNRWSTDDGVERGTCEFCVVDKTENGFCDMGAAKPDG